MVFLPSTCTISYRNSLNSPLGAPVDCATIPFSMQAFKISFHISFHFYFCQKTIKASLFFLHSQYISVCHWRTVWNRKINNFYAKSLLPKRSNTKNRSMLFFSLAVIQPFRFLVKLEFFSALSTALIVRRD